MGALLKREKQKHPSFLDLPSEAPETEKPIANIKKDLPHMKSLSHIPSVNLTKVKHLEALMQHFLYLLYTACLEDEDAVSGLIYAWQERGKSTVVLAIKCLGLLVEDDITAYGLSRKLSELYEKGKLKLYHHLLLPDLEKVSARTTTVKNELRSFLQTIMFDGVQRIDTYNIHLDFKKRTKLAVIACVTPDVFDEQSSFRRLGFLSRLIPFSFDYTNLVIDEIIKFIGTIQEDNLRMQTFKVLRHKKALITISNHYLRLLEEKAKELALIVDNFCKYPKVRDGNEKRLIGTRAKKLLVCYVKAIALEQGKSEVDIETWTEFLRMFEYFNFDMKAIE